MALLNSKVGDRISIRKDYADLPMVYCNGGKLNQVFMNLMSNALFAIEKNLNEGHIDQGELIIRTKKSRSTIVIELEDNGCGMSKETRQKIFEPFFTTQDVGEGTGLDFPSPIPFCNSTMLGSKSVQSSPKAVGSGSLFLKYSGLDLMSKEKEIRVLYLDDEPANLNAFRASFRREFDIRITSNGEEALELLGSFKPQIVFSDQRMPGMNGTEFLAKVHELRPHTIRILLTAYTDADEIIKAVNIGRIYRFISKPWIEEDLRQTILNGYDIYTTRQSLVEKVEELQKTNEELNKFIYSASHDLRAPLMSILGVVKLSELDPMDESARNLFQMIESSVVRMDTFISSIIEYYQNSRSVHIFRRSTSRAGR